MGIWQLWIQVFRMKVKAIFAACLAVLVCISGIPFIPGAGVQKAYAGTSARVSPYEVMTVYGGKMDISWNYTDPGEGQTSHPTNVEICGQQSLVSGRDYPVIVTNTVTWNGQIQGKPALDGSYQACVTPTDFNFPGKADFRVKNPAPPAPKALEALPDLNSTSHVIRGIAEIGTKVTLQMWVTKRLDNNRLVQFPEIKTIAADVPVTPGRTWSSGVSIDGYFPQFPTYTDKRPADFVGEWQIEVTLPEYEIAHITATATRELDNKASGPSEALQVLRYTAPTWDVKWAELAGYYYNADSVESLSARISEAASFNHVTIKTCSDGQNCPGFIDKGTNLLLMNPLAAGNILNQDIADINQAFVNKYGHPIPEHLDPINLATGGFSFHHTNMSLQAAMPLSFTLTYHTRDSYNGINGVGWHHSLDWHLSKSDGGNRVVVSPDGASSVYIPKADGQYVTPPGVFNTLVRRPDQTFELETPQKLRYIFREDGLLHQIVDANGKTATFFYQDTILQQVTTEGASMSFTYGEGGKLAQLTDQSGRSVRYRYDAVNHDLLAMVLPDGAEIGFEYDVRHRMTAIHNPNKTASLINVYDDQDRVVEQQDFSGEWSYVTYDPERRKTTTKDARGKTRTFTFDERYRQTEIAYADGTTEAFTYDANDKMTSRKDRNGNTSTYIYDEKGNLLQQKDPTGAITSILYNAFNKPEQITDALGQITRIGYDSHGNVISATNGLNETVTVAVDGRGFPTSVQNANGETTVFTNDAAGFASAITDPAGFSKELTRDALHRVTDVTDSLGNRTHMDYDPRDRVKTKVDGLHQEEGFEYDSNSNLIRHTDPHVSGETNPAETRYAYDTFDRLLAVTDALGQTTSFTYDEVGNRTSMTDAKGAATLYTYDDVNRLVEVKDPQGNVTKLSYDGNGNLLTKEDARFGKTVITYDKRSLPLMVADAEQGTTAYAYDALGRLTSATNVLGQTTRYTYDAAGKVTQVTDAAGQVTFFEYDKAGRLIKQTKPNGAVWAMEYDKRGLLTGTVDPLGHRKELVRDELGRVQATKDEQGQQTSYTYDPLNRVQSLLDALGNKTEFAYDPTGRMKQVQDANGHATSYEYDKLGRLTNVINGLNQTTSYDYDAVHNLIAKTDANGHSTFYEYDPLRQLTKETDALGRTTELSYDSVGNVTGMKSPDQTRTRYTYDLMSRLTGIQYEDGKQVGYTYDPLGRRTSMTDSIGTSSYQYDVLNRLTQVTDAYNQTIQYEWTPTGQRKKMIYPDQSVVTYDVDVLDRITGVTDASGGHTAYTYDARGRLVSKVLPTQAVSTYEYDAVGQVRQIRHTNQQGNMLEQLTYAYDPVGNRIRTERLLGGDDEDDGQEVAKTDETIVTQYAYDALNQLAQVQQQNGEDAESRITTSYTYDQGGNRVSKGMVWGDLASTEQYTYNGADQLTHWQNGASYKDYTYDQRGNLLKVLGVVADETDGTSVSHDAFADVSQSVYSNPETSGETSGETTPEEAWLEQYVWDTANRLTKQINPEGDMTQYTYDGDGNRMGMIIDLAHGPDGRNSGKGNGNHGNGNSNGNGNGNDNGNDNNNNGNSSSKCDQVVPAGFVPPGLAKKCGQRSRLSVRASREPKRWLGACLQAEAQGIQIYE